MNKIKKALEQIKNKKQAPDALEYLTMLKSEMSGREMSSDDLNTYEKLGEMEHSLYRYNSFLKAGLPENAEKEGEKFFSMSKSPDGAIMLKGGISNCRYVWQTEKGACEACQALDGKEFETLDDVPERPHPNCKCDIVPILLRKVVANTENNEKENDNNEYCNCLVEINIIIEQINNSIAETENCVENIDKNIKELINDYVKIQNMISKNNDFLFVLDNDTRKHLFNCKNNIDTIYEQITEQINNLNNLSIQVLGLLNPLLAFVNTCKVFCQTFLHCYMKHIF